MSNNLVGSDLTRAMLSRGDKQVWCAVSNDSDEQAITTINNANYSGIHRIVSFNSEYLICSEGNLWVCAVPVKRIEMRQSEVKI
ncbi:MULTISPECIES: hypothetical protein [unclassified Psychrobacter]|uniref:hypothetical protein n=1 Tax=unclassified Psychrobacter TaxID=196806 RepID=UPI00078D8DF0|nr:hypothetical protein [Psychrobacter sp. P11G5]AMN68550.1 hypothetical protein AK825_13350 [Psychrobacter sp. P11G5]